VSYLHAVRLVAVREMVERARSRTFIISLAISMISVVVVVLISAFVISGKGKSVSMRLEGATTSLEQPLQAAASQANLDLHFQAAQGSDADAAAVRKGDVDAALGGDPAQPTVTVQQTLDPTFTAVLLSITRQIQIQEHFQAAGLSPSQASTVLQATPPKVVSLQSGDRDLDARKTAAFIGGLLLYMSLLFGGFAVAGGVVSEKSGRVVELLLATLRPAQMLAGKVLGIGAISLLQFALIIGTGAVTSLVVGSARIPSSVLVAAPQALLWFVLGFLFYAVLYAAAGALAQRFEDLQSVTLPFTLFLVLGYALTFPTLNTPDAAYVRFASFFPPTAPLIMPLRAAVGSASWWEQLLAVVLILAATALFLRVGGRIYRRGILSTGGKRPSLRSLLHRGGEEAAAA